MAAGDPLSPLIGVVLTGGASRRMGRNKALIDIDGIPMARRVAMALDDAGCVAVRAYGGDPRELAPVGIRVDRDRYPATGPLGGVLGALEVIAEEFPDGAMFAAACDLAYLTGDALLAMVASARCEPSAQVVVARTSILEPACAIWRTSASGALRAIFDEGVRALHVAIARLDVLEVAVDPAALRNINTPEELERCR